MRYSIVYLLLLCSLFATSQNLVPNPSFETVTKIPKTWSPNSQIFESGIEEWTSPNGGSPDIFFIGNMGKFKFKRPNVNTAPHAPRSGKYMLGIKTYGCISGTLHCKEYLQVKLTTPIETGKEYYAEFWVNPIASSVKVNNFGILFYEEAMSGGDGQEAIWIRPHIQMEEVIDAKPNAWVRVSAKFTASCDCSHLLIGNFNMDEDTEAIRKESDLEYSYYFVDDVSVRPIDVPTDLNSINLEVGNTVQLDRIYFPHDKADLLPKSFAQLDELVALLQQQENMKIQINGHTDAIGDDTYNLTLSKQRAQAVAHYLHQKGIVETRFSFEGYGETQALASNETKEGRQLNRRVEFLIVEI